MIYTRFGGQVTIIGHDKDGWVFVKRTSGDNRWFDRGELRADGGQQEIDAAIASCPRLSELSAPSCTRCDLLRRGGGSEELIAVEHETGHRLP